jgi:hypothetical protein
MREGRASAGVRESRRHGRARSRRRRRRVGASGRWWRAARRARQARERACGCERARKQAAGGSRQRALWQAAPVRVTGASAERARALEQEQAQARAGETAARARELAAQELKARQCSALSGLSQKVEAPLEVSARLSAMAQERSSGLAVPRRGDSARTRTGKALEPRVKDVGDR